MQEVPYKDLDGKPSTVRHFVAKQSLSSVLNSPTRSRTSVVPVEPVPASKKLPNIDLVHFLQYAREQTAREQQIDSVKASFEQLSSPKIQAIDADEAIKNLQKDVPEIFFTENFQFHDPEVLEYVIQTGWNSPNLQQEKFSHYLDLVEVELVQQISTQSNSFFMALSRLHHLRDEVTAACDEISNLRKAIRGLGNSTTQSLGVINILQRQKNMDSVYSKISLIKTVKETQPTVQLLLSNNDFIGALDLIERTQDILNKQLNGVQCLRHLGFQLKEMVNVISKLMQEEFLRFAVTANPENKDSVDFTTLENEISPSAIGLMHLHRMHVVNEQYSERAGKAIHKAICLLVDILPAAGNNAVQAQGQIVENSIRGLSTKEFIDWMQEQVKPTLISHLSRAAEVRKVLQALLGVLLKPESTESRDSELSGIASNDKLVQMGSHIKKLYCEQVLTDNQNALFRLCEAAQKEVSNVLLVRTEQHARSQLQDFSTIYHFVQSFIEESEIFTHRQCLNLRGTLSSEAKKFVITFHESRMSTIALILDNENWAQAKVAQEFQDIVDSLFHVEKKESHTTSSGVYFVLVIDGEEYCVVNSALMFLKMLSEYLQCVEEIPSLSYEMVNRITEILKLWTSRACQLIIGAGAMAMANLKSITATNLALSSRCLKLFARMIPQIKENLSIHFPAEKHALLNNFDRVTLDYVQHYQEIIEKLKFIVKQRIDSCCRNLAESDIWNSFDSNPSNYMVKAGGAAESLHKVLFRLYPESELQNVFSEIFALYNSTMVEYFSTLRLNKSGKKRLYKDITYLIDTLSKLNGISEQAASLGVLKIFFESQFGTVPQ